jgi:hypothetical protein
MRARQAIAALVVTFDSRGIVRLATLSGFAAYPQLSTLLHAPRVRATPLIRQRLAALAQALQYTGRCGMSANVTTWMPPKDAAKQGLIVDGLFVQARTDTRLTLDELAAKYE